MFSCLQILEARSEERRVGKECKSIGNAIILKKQSFGFQTAVAEATRATRSGHEEAKSYPNGIGRVKLMGRHSGFIASYAALAMSDTNFVLIPEVPFFFLQAEDGIRVRSRHSC